MVIAAVAVAAAVFAGEHVPDRLDQSAGEIEELGPTVLVELPGPGVVANAFGMNVHRFVRIARRSAQAVGLSSSACADGAKRLQS
jgi:hypothetical protein